MKNYREYKKEVSRKYWEHINTIKNQWWKNTDQEYQYHFNNIKTTGDYIETTMFISTKEKNDVPICVNHTNIKSSEWNILFELLAQALIDWCIENDVPDFWSYGVFINREIRGNENVFNYSFSIEEKYGERNRTSPEYMNGCSEFLCDLFNEFLQEQGKNIPNDWDYFGFCLDGMAGNMQSGEWNSFADGSLILKNKLDKIDSFVECM